MDFFLATDSTCDLTTDMLNEMDIRCINLSFFVNDKEYRDQSTLGAKDFYDQMRNGAKTSTSMANESSATDFLTELLSQGKDVLFLAFASVLSGTYNCFVNAANALNEKFDNKVYVVDSKCASGGEGLFVTLVNEKRQEGVSAEQAYNYAESLREHILHYFVVDDLKYLARGGRLSRGSAILGKILNIKPLLHVDEEGRLIAIKKTMGRRKSLKCLVDKIEERYNGESKTVYITHGDCYDDAKFVADEIKDKLGLTPLILSLGYVIGSHSGPGTVALFFTGDTRKED
ncbi:MAG: DegV family protein [Clostridiales bacterium]|nr:DegV family protein [Clostridiales bacterium]